MNGYAEEYTHVSTLHRNHIDYHILYQILFLFF